MENRFVSIWFRYLKTDWFTLRHPKLKSIPFVLKTSIHGRMVITAANNISETHGIRNGMVLADARAIMTELEALDDKPELIEKLLTRIAEWCIRFTPIVAIDPPDGISFDASGCSHLWGGDEEYLNDITRRLNNKGYDVSIGMADTLGVAWAIARYGRDRFVIPSGAHTEALLGLPPEALRLDDDTTLRLHKLGLHQIRQFSNISRSSLKRRFGEQLISRLNKALGQEIEILNPVNIAEDYHERLPCIEPIITATGIEYALQQLLEKLCLRLKLEQKGLRNVAFKAYRVDGKIEKIEIGTHKPSHHVNHLFKLLELKISTIEPALGIELFVLEATNVEDHYALQENMWEGIGGLEDVRVSELIDHLSVKIGSENIHRYLPDEHYWPERSIKVANNLHEKLTTVWREDKVRPIQLLSSPERIDVSAPIPDYPPMLFRYKGNIHNIRKADGPERIEQEWWLQQGEHRDYYRVEDEHGCRYWIFRLGHYDNQKFLWFLHGFFA